MTDPSKIFSLAQQLLDVVAEFRAEEEAPGHVDAEIGDEIAGLGSSALRKDMVSPER